MYSKIIKNDIKRNKLISIVIALFILVAALLTSLAVILSINLFGAIDNMMVKAKTPHFMQMHSGVINNDRLLDFADSQDNVASFQVLDFLNIEGTEIIIGDYSLASSVQDNGLSKQSEKFDFLLDLHGNVIHPNEGEIYVPIYYMKEGQADIGDTITIDGVAFTVAGFLRDSQMNAALISSKRFLVSENDFRKVEDFGKSEYLIEFRLIDDSLTSELETAYLKAGLEANGPPAITYPMFKLANAISDGIMIAVLILVSVLVIIVTFLCIRFTLLAKIEEDYKEIGVLKAIGLRVASIKNIYMVKYGAIAGIASILGFLLSLILQNPLMENIRLYMGEGNHYYLSLLFGVTGALVIFLVVLLYVNKVLRRFKKISAAQAIRFGAPQEKSKNTRRFQLNKNKILTTNIFLGIKDILSRKKLYITMLLVIIISSFLMIVPQNIYNTISARSFMTYMGIGECDMRIDIQQTDDILEKTTEVASFMEEDDSISKHTVLVSYMFDLIAQDSSTRKFKVELGDHSLFPIEYSTGREPQNETEIALSTLNADDLEKNIGDTISLVVDGNETLLTVCGVYSDITNGGKTAKATFKTEQTDILWSIIPVQFYNKSLIGLKITEYRQLFTFAKVANINEYISQTFGTTIAAIKNASYCAIIATILLSILVTLLFMKMLVAKDSYQISILKSLGFKSSDIHKQYLTRSIIVLILGVIVGTVLANTLGELVGVLLISSFGVSTLHFEINPLFAYLFLPLIIGICVYIATLFGISDIRSLKISEHIKE